MALKAPGLLTFLVSLLLTLTALAALVAPQLIPFLENKALWVLFAAHGILILGCVMRGL